MIFESKEGDKILVEVTPYKNGDPMFGVVVECHRVGMECEYAEHLNEFGRPMYRRKTKTIITIYHSGETL